MASPHPVARSRTYPVTLDDAFPVTLATPLPDLFNRRYGPIPPITAVDQEGPWATVGQPNAFTYELTDIRGPLRPLVARVDGAWTFEPVGTGCRITWSWTIHPQSGAGALVLPVFGRLWQGYARRALDHLEEILLAA